ncbi:RNA polymerase sigma factor [Chloroflexi bacterium TSY]|nr:RNA polymerase sigma factor [Chloroflexi bacterium TSY]
MEATNTEFLTSFETVVANERTNLLRFCTHLTGSSQAAEDLTQETLLTAWRRRNTTTNLDGLSHWLKAIARNVCRNWQRSQARQYKHLSLVEPHATQKPHAEFELADDFDLDIELERSELATLLDRAMDLLPEQTRGLLVQHYIEELPQAELAARAGLSTGAVGVLLHRGKLALRKALINDFREDAVAHGLVMPSDVEWVETRIWCMRCGQHRLQGHFDHAKNFLHLRCSSCCERSVYAGTITYTHSTELQGVKAFKPALSRLLSWDYMYGFGGGSKLGLHF